MLEQEEHHLVGRPAQDTCPAQAHCCQAPLSPLTPSTFALPPPMRQAHSEDRYRWWVQRFQRSLQLYDETRVDHFRAFAGYWAVGAQEETGVQRRGGGTGGLALGVPAAAC